MLKTQKQRKEERFQSNKIAKFINKKISTLTNDVTQMAIDVEYYPKDSWALARLDLSIAVKRLHIELWVVLLDTIRPM